MSMSTPFSLHCSICIEEFDREKRPPVVLPCGHTYICQVCSSKLTHCAICRIALFRTVSQPEHTPRSSRSINTRRPAGQSSAYSPARQPTYSPSRASPLNTPTKTQNGTPRELLPIPKNLVLLSLMELSARKHEDAGESISDEEEKDLFHGANILKSSTGTYVVRAPDGVNVFPTKLDALNEGEKILDENDLKVTANDVDGVEGLEVSVSSSAVLVEPDLEEYIEEKSVPISPGVEEYSEEDSVPKSPVSKDPDGIEPEGGANSQQDSEPTSPVSKDPDGIEPQGREVSGLAVVHVDWGRTLQVVHIEGGIATLARNRGFVRVGECRLAKIGAATDDACILEAQIKAIEARKHQLLTGVEELEESRQDSFSQLEKVLLEPEGEIFSYAPGAEKKQAGQPDDEAPFDEQKVVDFMATNNSLEPPLDMVPLTGSSSTTFIPRMQGLTLNMTRETMHIDNEIVSPSFGCTDAILPFLCTEDDFGVRNVVPAVSPSPQNSDPTRQDAINFRTGMSGHRGLGRASSRGDRNPQQRAEVRMMGEHRGAGSIRRIVQRSSSETSPGSQANTQLQTIPSSWASYLRQSRSNETT